MPKIVDHELQKAKVAEATWRVIQKHGIEQASVRNIAEEAGISVGSMRHYFSTQSELLSYSMKRVSERVSERVYEKVFTGDLMQDIPSLLHEVLPTDDEKRLEMEVWFSFVVKSLSDESLRPLRHQVDDELRSIFVTVFNGLSEKRLLLPGLDFAIEVERFYAVLDGLAIHAVMRPDRVTPEVMVAVIERHLVSLCQTDVSSKSKKP
ncbi:TetR/AcrR family transcriptional regulator [Paenibacillus sp. XY044]|uniref:TetR/AcrR family transcriptional regulator n=1 Tax=Paenibacillus sp. XY044 TaxID=2026089 RepID=UPI000B98D84E|nr:TetR/AcrR family transcriptional regulator [Paenibacillus sp. XY044]OZB90226.1 TetR family transcriptional regulator [Paenibacillus sp. XY044]